MRGSSGASWIRILLVLLIIQQFTAGHPIEAGLLILGWVLLSELRHKRKETDHETHDVDGGRSKRPRQHVEQRGTKAKRRGERKRDEHDWWFW